MTIELLGEYNRLYDEDPDKAKAFAESKKDNKLFYGIITLLEETVPALCAQKDFMINGVAAAMAEDSPKIQQVLMDHIKVETSARAMDYLNEFVQNEIAGLNT